MALYSPWKQGARRLAIFKRGAGLRERGAAFDESIILFIM